MFVWFISVWQKSHYHDDKPLLNRVFAINIRKSSSLRSTVQWSSYFSAIPFLIIMLRFDFTCNNTIPVRNAMKLSSRKTTKRNSVWTFLITLCQSFSNPGCWRGSRLAVLRDRSRLLIHKTLGCTYQYKTSLESRQYSILSLLRVSKHHVGTPTESYGSKY